MPAPHNPLDRQGMDYAGKCAIICPIIDFADTDAWSTPPTYRQEDVAAGMGAFALAAGSVLRG